MCLPHVTLQASVPGAESGLDPKHLPSEGAVRQGQKDVRGVISAIMTRQG